MNRPKNIQFWLALVLWSTSVGSVFAQNEKALIVDGFVKSKSGALYDASVKVLQDSLFFIEVFTEKNGQFEVTLPYGHEYTLAISKKGFEAKSLAISTTNLPEHITAGDYAWGGWTMTLLRSFKGFTPDIFKHPVAHGMYQQDMDEFDWDYDYLKKIIPKIRETEKAHDKIVKKNKALLEQQETQYEALLAEGNTAFKEQDYDKAREKYAAAIETYPGKSFPELRIEEINQKLSAFQLSDSLIALGDKAMATDSLEKAVSLYESALNLNSDYAKAKSKRSEAKQLLAKREQEERAFKEYLASGDKAISKEAFASAKEQYQKALVLYPDNENAKNKLARAEKLIANRQAALAEEAKLQSLAEKAQYAYSSGNYSRADSLIKRATAIGELSGEMAELRSEVTVAIAKQKEEQRVEDAYQNNILAADSLIALGEFASAEKLLKKAESLRPERQEEIAAVRADAVKEKERAVAEKERQAQIARREEQANNQLKLAQAAKEEGDLERAKLLLDNALRNAPNHQGLYEEQKRINQALAFKKQVEIDQRTLTAALKKADQLKSSGNITGAIDELARASKGVQPTAHTAELLKQISAKKEAFTQTRQRQYELYLRNASHALNNNDVNGAITYYNRASRLMPDEPFPKQRIDELTRQRKASGSGSAANNNAAKKAGFGDELDKMDKSSSSFQSALAARYPQGVTEEKKEFDDRTVVRRIVVEGGKGTMYTKVTYNWGGLYYFKNGKSITSFIWNKETAK